MRKYIKFGSGETYWFGSKKQARAKARRWGLSVKFAESTPDGYIFHNVQQNGTKLEGSGAQSYTRTYRDSNDQKPVDVPQWAITYMTKLTRELESDFNFGYPIKIRFSNKQGGYHRVELVNTDNPQHRLTYGYPLIQSTLETGYREPYQISKHLWDDWANEDERRLKGKIGLHAIVLHEFAHLWHYHKYGREKGVSHPPTWLELLEELKEMYPCPEED